MGGWCEKFSNFMDRWCSTKSNYMGGWYFAAWNGKEEYYLPKKREVLSNQAKRKRRTKQTAAETAIFVSVEYMVKTGTQINSLTVAPVMVIASFWKHVFSEEFIQGNNAIG